MTDFLKKYFDDKNKCRLLFIMMIALSLLLVYGAMILMGHEYVYYDIGGGDEPETYIPILVNYIERISDGNLSIYNFNNGFGTSGYSFLQLVFNPFLLFVVIIGVVFGTKYIISAILFAQIINILSCGLLCYKYLDYFEGKYISKSISSYMLAFNAYLVLFSQHYLLMDFQFYFLIFLILIEEILRCSKIGRWHFYFALACFVVMSRTIYLGYMIGIFAVFYTIFRLIQKYSIKDIKRALLDIVRMGIFALMGFMMSIPFIIPTFMDIINSNRVTGRGESVFGLLAPYNLLTYKTLLYRLLSTNLMGIGNDFFGYYGDNVSDYYQPPELFFSVFILLFIVVYYYRVITKYTKKQAILRFAAGALIAFIIFIPIGSAAFNAFVTYFGRYTFLLMPIFAIVSMTAVDEILCNPKISLYLIPLAITMVLVAVQVRSGIGIFGGDDSLKARLFIVALFILAGILALSLPLFILKERFQGEVFILCLAFLCFSNSTSEAFLTVNFRAYCPYVDVLKNYEYLDTQKAITYLDEYESEMYRLEKDYYDIVYFNDALFQKYNGISCYHSTMNEKLKAFYNNYYNTAVNFYGYDSFWYSGMKTTMDTVPNALLGVKYIVSRGEDYPEDLYEPLHSDGDISIFKNNVCDSFGVFFSNAISEEEALSLPKKDRQSIISKAVVLKGEDVNGNIGEYLDYDGLKSKYPETTAAEYEGLWIGTEADGGAVIDLPEGSLLQSSFIEIALRMPYSQSLSIAFDTGGGFDRYHPYYLRGTDAEEICSARIMIPSDTKSVMIVANDEPVTADSIRVVTGETPAITGEGTVSIKEKKDSCLIGEMSSEKSGYLLLPIAYEDSWKARVDGTFVKPLCADSGLMAIPLSEGRHDLVIQYEYPLWRVGLVLSILSAVSLSAMYIWMRRRQSSSVVG